MRLNTSWIIFSSTLTDIENHIDCQQKLKDMLISIKTARKVTKKIRQAGYRLISNSTNEKLFDYRSTIISIYGSFEQFVESLAKEYIINYNKVHSSFSVMEDTIVKNYYSKWQSLHTKLSYPKFSSLNEQIMAQNLYDTICCDKNLLLPECFILNGGNYRPDIVLEMLSAMGRTNAKDALVKYPKMQDYLSENGLEAEPIKKQCSKLEDLVDYRNEIAHGAPSSIIAEEEIKEIIKFLKCFGESLNEYMSDSLSLLKWNAMTVNEYKPTNVYRNKIAVFNIDNAKISVGDVLKIRTSDGIYPKFISAEVNRIGIEQPDGTTLFVNDLSVATHSVISIQLSHNITIGYGFKFQTSS